MSVKIPFEERKTKSRGVLDLIGGCYPAFLFGGSVGDILPVFHFHDVTREYLEPYLMYLDENGYKTVTSVEMGRFVRDGVGVGEKRVALCFDDSWAGVWTVVVPLMRKHGMRAITYAIPGRVPDAEVVREEGEFSFEGDFATWPELRAMSSEGVMDVQAHTYSHAMMFYAAEPVDFVAPGSGVSFLSRPALKFGSQPVFLENTMLGAPLYPARSRMSDALRYIDDESIRDKCIAHVKKSGGTEFFKGDDWREDLKQIVAGSSGRMESAVERERAVMDELVMAREVLSDKLKSDTVRQICFPWGICGSVAEHFVKEAGYETAVADELFGKRCAVKHGNPYRIMRLKHQYIFCLPGRGRKMFFNA